jgi:hypothetical protein
MTQWTADCRRWGLFLTLAICLAWGAAWRAYGPNAGGAAHATVGFAVSFLIGIGVAAWLHWQMDQRTRDQ